MKIMEFQKKYLLWRMDFSEPLRIPVFRVLETGETGETHTIELKNPELRIHYRKETNHFTIILKININN